MNSKKGEALIIFHTGGPFITKPSGMGGIKPTTLITESHQLVVNKVKPIVTLSFSILLIIALLLLLGFIIPASIVIALGPRLDSYISTLALFHID